MIEFYAENAFKLPDEENIKKWLNEVIIEEGYTLGELTVVFCDDDYLLNINQEFLQHDTLTDIITFDYNLGKEVHGEIYISTERVSENALEFNVSATIELARVLVHGVLHLCGYKDKSQRDEMKMRNREDYYLAKAPHLSY